MLLYVESTGKGSSSSFQWQFSWHRTLGLLLPPPTAPYLVLEFFPESVKPHSKRFPSQWSRISTSYISAAYVLVPLSWHSRLGCTSVFQLMLRLLGNQAGKWP